MTTETVNELGPDSKGRWLITTQGSRHLWDLDAMTTQRVNEDGLNPMDGDGAPVKIASIDQWPSVGDVFFIHRQERPSTPTVIWHLSSRIRSIEAVA